MAVETVALPDGRRVAFARYGAADGVPVLALHGTPGSHLKYALGDRQARETGLLLISVDRWAYGGTDDGRPATFAQFADDMGALMDQLGVERFSVVGISGGGPFAAATSVYLGGRVERLALVAPVANVGAAQRREFQNGALSLVLFSRAGAFAACCWAFV